MRIQEDAGELGEHWAAGHVACLLNGAVLPHNGEVLPSFSSVPKVLRMALGRSLRSLVDRWIDSGRSPDGVDKAHSRSVYWLPAGGAEPLCNVLEAWNRRHAPDVVVLPSGERDVRMGKPKRDPKDPENWDWASLMSMTYDPLPSSEREAAEIAIYWLQKLLESPDSYRIARCDNPDCRAYYLRARVRKSEITRGTYCRDCANVGAIARVNAGRAQRRRELVSRAADVWNQFKPTANHRQRSDWVAAQMKKHVRTAAERIQGKWVTRNQAEIEAEVERRKNAES
jgi:hypothetical protein